MSIYDRQSRISIVEGKRIKVFEVAVFVQLVLEQVMLIINSIMLQVNMGQLLALVFVDGFFE